MLSSVSTTSTVAARTRFGPEPTRASSGQLGAHHAARRSHTRRESGGELAGFEELGSYRSNASRDVRVIPCLSIVKFFSGSGLCFPMRKRREKSRNFFLSVCAWGNRDQI